MRRTIALVFSVALLCAGPTAQGCAAVVPIIAAVASVVTEITSVLNAIEGKVPGAIPDDLHAALAEAKASLVALQAAAHAKGGVASKEYAAAVEHALEAYQRVVNLAQVLGVRAAPEAERGRLGAVRGGPLLVPPSSELRAGLLSGGAR